MKAYRGLLAALAVVVALVVAPLAQAAFPSAYGGEISCAAQPLNGDITRLQRPESLPGTGRRKSTSTCSCQPESGGTEVPTR